MNRFDGDEQKLDDDGLHVVDPLGPDAAVQNPDETTNDVLERGDEFADKIPMDLDDPVIDRTQELKGKVDA